MKSLINKRNYKWILMYMAFVLVVSSCKDYLDVVPDNVATLEDAFSLRQNAERYLYNCYSFMPESGNPLGNIGLLSGDEIWFNPLGLSASSSFAISRGTQRVSDPYFNAWAGRNGSSSFYRGIRECNTFLENVSDMDKIPDLLPQERQRWLGEVEFLKAFYHFYLLRMYGPIPIMYENIPIYASEEEVQVERRPVDEVVDYIVELLDSAAPKLPLTINNRATELGRITQPVALALKAKVLLMAASPLFNGNSDMATLVNKDGTQLFNLEEDLSKWQRAADAAKAAIENAESAVHRLFQFVDIGSFKLSDTTIRELSIRQAVSERWGEETIWGNSQSPSDVLQQLCIPPLEPGVEHRIALKVLSAPLKIAREFHTKNGVPIEEDRTLDFTKENESRVAVTDERFYIEEGGATARLNFDREPRFYASVGFDRGIWYKKGTLEADDENTFVLHALNGEYGGSSHTFFFNVTGYYIKKLVDWNAITPLTGSASFFPYAWPEIRLSDVYLMYAEALNEAGGAQAEVLEYVDKVRERGGLSGVAESWTNFSINPSKFTTKEGRREIIQRERLIELAFEGQRFWDLMRWKKAVVEFNRPITGWNVKGQDFVSYYQVNTLWSQEFVSPRDYFWPIAEQEILENPNLVQNIGW